MSVNDRVLPQWLVDLKTGISSSDKKSDKRKTRGKNTPLKNLSDGNDNSRVVASEVNSTKCKTPAKCVNKSEINNKVNGNTKKESGSSPRKRGGKSRPCQDLSSSEEESDLGEIRKQGNISAATFIEEQEVQFDSIKEKNESSDATDFEIDVSVKKGKIEDSLCNDEPGNHKTLSHSLIDVKDHINEDNAAGSGNNAVADTVGDAEFGATTASDTIDNSAMDDQDNTGRERNANASLNTDPNIDISDTANEIGNDHDSGPANNTISNSHQIVRAKCKYGTQCYRKNPQHRSDYSHPGDVDFTAVDNRPECQFGLACYRKNHLHRQAYKHTKKMQKPRQDKRPRNDLADDNASENEEDDYDLDDPFIDNGSSDDYQPSDSDSGTDYEGEEEAEGDNRKKKEEKQADRKKVLKKEHRRSKRKDHISGSDTDSETDFDGEEEGEEEKLDDRKKKPMPLKRKRHQ